MTTNLSAHVTFLSDFFSSIPLLMTALFSNLFFANVY
jgi:hypothetical protein